MDDTGGLGGEGFKGSGVKAAIGLAYVAGVDVDAGAMFWGDDQVGTLLEGLADAIADEEGEASVGLALEEFAHELDAEEAGGAGEQDEFVVVHAGGGLIARTLAKAVQHGPFGGWAKGNLLLIIVRAG